MPRWLWLDIIVDKYFKQMLTRNPKNINVALTFDDAPYTDKSFKEILTILDEYGMKGTFFVISDFVNNKNIDMLVEAVRNGHQLANHGKTNSIQGLKSRDDFEKELLGCDHSIKDIYIKANQPLPKKMLYRPHNTFFTKSVLDVLNQHNYQLTFGGTYPHDPIVHSPNINYHYIINHMERGDIIILHDRAWTASLLKQLLSYFSKNNIRSIKVDELFE